MNNMYKHFFIGGLLSVSSLSINAAVPLPFVEGLDASIDLSSESLGEDGGHLTASVSLTNTGEEDVNIKYWITVKGPQGLIFPAKSVVGTNSSVFGTDEVEDGDTLMFDRGIWVYDYMNDGAYVVSLEGVNTDTGDTFQQTAQFTKGINNGIKSLGDLDIEAYMVGTDHVSSDGGYTVLAFNVGNNGTMPANVEFWINASAPNGFDIPVHAREHHVIAPGASKDVLRGFWLDAAYPDGDYVIKTQLYNKDTGERVEYKVDLIKGML